MRTVAVCALVAWGLLAGGGSRHLDPTKLRRSLPAPVAGGEYPYMDAGPGYSQPYIQPIVEEYLKGP